MECEKVKELLTVWLPHTEPGTFTENSSYTTNKIIYLNFYK